MSNSPEILSRRDCLKRGLSSLVTLPLGFVAASTSVLAAENPATRVSESEPTAQALGYVHDAAQADITKFPKRAGASGAQQFCSNCNFFQADAQTEWGPCVMFGNKLVRGQGWCNGWVAKTA